MKKFYAINTRGEYLSVVQFDLLDPIIHFWVARASAVKDLVNTGFRVTTRQPSEKSLKVTV